VAGVESRDFLLCAYQIAGINAAVIQAGGGEPHGFKVSREEAVATIQQHQQRGGYNNPTGDKLRRELHWLLGTPGGDPRKQSETHKRQG